MPFNVSHQHDEQQDRTARSFLLIGVVTAAFFLLIIRLFYIQVVKADENIRLSIENGMQLHVLKAPRGRIFDRNGVVLARNRPSYSICVLPYKLRNSKVVVSRLCQIRDTADMPVFDSLELLKAIRNARMRRFDATRIAEDVGIDMVSIIEEHSMELPGIVVVTESRREYPLGPCGFHVLGYMSGIPETNFDSLKAFGYQYDDLIGKAGIEKQYEDIFRGKDGQEFVEVNAYGKVMGAITAIPRIEPVPGHDLYLNIDSRLQLKAQEVFPDTLKGAVVALDPRSGEVLIMLSRPTVDPNIFSASTTLRAKRWAAVATDPSLPLNCRATAGTYSPGSTFKLISATTGLATGKMTGSTMMRSGCSGAYRIGRRIAHCWKLTGHGRLPLISAVQQSCNIFFYQTGLMLGDEQINHYAALFGFGTKTGIDFPVEKSGWLSGEKAYNERFKDRGWKWTGGLVCDLAIGQAQLTTPIQLAGMVGALGKCETLFTPVLLKEERTAGDSLVRKTKPVPRSVINLTPEVREVIHEAMAAVMEAGGTGGWARVPGVTVGGKTGSAENPQGDKTHALFIACAPLEDPVIAIAVVVENAGHGGSIAAPIAGNILRYYFKDILNIPPDSTRVAFVDSVSKHL